MRNTKKTVVLVDAFSTGKYLVDKFNDSGYQCVHLRSNKPLPIFFIQSFKKEAYAECLEYTGDLNNVVQQLANYNVHFVIPGIDSGVVLADLIANELNLDNANDSRTVMNRRDKYLMNSVLSESNVPAPKHILYKKNDYCDNLTIDYPVVAKPALSTGSDHVYFCHNRSEFLDATNKIFESIDRYGHENNVVLIQEVLEGDEYVVNTVSFKGTHFVTDIWKLHKRRMSADLHDFAYDHAELISIDDEAYLVLVDYIEKVLTALGIHYGAAHSEVILTNSGPRLVETANRMEGSMIPRAVEEALGHSQLSILLEAYTNSEQFLSRSSRNVNKPKSHCKCVYFISEQSGRVEKDSNIDLFSNLPSYYYGEFSLKNGEIIRRTNLLKYGETQSPGYLYLVHNSEKQLIENYLEFRRIEHKMFQQIIMNNKTTLSLLFTNKSSAAQTDSSPKLIRGILYNGKWVAKDQVHVNVEYQNITNTGIIHEPNRYHIYASYACPYAHRALLAVHILGLEDVISTSFVHWEMHTTQGWQFTDSSPDIHNQFTFLHQIYSLSHPSYTGAASVPVLWDIREMRIVNNESKQIVKLLNDCFKEYASESIDLYPEQIQREVCEMVDYISSHITSGVYRVNSASSDNYQAQVNNLFNALDKMESMLANKTYLFGNQITAADLCFIPTLLRFDTAYFEYFKCDKRKISDYKHLSDYLSRFKSMEAVKKSFNEDYMLAGYRVAFNRTKESMSSGIALRTNL